MDLSVVVVSFETRALTLDCLARVRSALARLEGAEALRSEVFVVDNGSRDGSAAAIRQAFPEIQLIELSANQGFARGANAALRKVRGRVVLLLNSDAYLEGDAVTRCLAVLDANPDCAIVGPALVHADGRPQNAIHAFPGLVTELVPAALLEWLLPSRFPSKRSVGRAPLEVEAVLGAALFVRREAMEQVGLLDEGYFFFLEETDWCWRMRAHGWRVLHEPSAQLVHLSGASSKRRDAAATRIEFHRSLYRFLGIHRGAVPRAVAVGLRVSRLALAIVLLGPLALFLPSQRERLASRWRLLIWHLSGCPSDAGLAQLPEPPPYVSGQG